MNRGSLIRRNLAVVGLLALLGALAFTSAKLLATERQLREARATAESADEQAQVVKAQLDSSEGKYRGADMEYASAETELAKANVIMDAMKDQLLARGVRSVRVSQCDLGLADQGRYRGDSAYYKGIPPICHDHGFVVVSTEPSAEAGTGSEGSRDAS